MSGGGASPAIQNKVLLTLSNGSSGTVTCIAIAGRLRVLISHNETDNKDYYIGGGPFGGLPLVSLTDSADVVKNTINNLIEIYGKANFIPDSYDSNNQKIQVFGDTYYNQDRKNPAYYNVYENCGFVEGQARIITDYGNIACVVKNGTLYPIITEYDQQIEDNKCLTSLYLNGDNMVLGLQEMVDRSGEYLPYDNTTVGEPWSPVENYLHQNVNMPIVPKIGFEPLDEVGIGNVLPGLNYEVTL